METRTRVVRDHFDSAADFYSELYEGETPKAHLLSSRLKIVYELLDNVEEKLVLDLGCGPGLIAGYLLQQNCSYTGIDLAMEMLLECKKRNSDYGSVYVSQGHMNNLPIRDNSCDIVLCLGALEYLDDIEAAIHEQSRVLKNHGLAILSMQNKWSPYRLWERYVYNGRLFDVLRAHLRRPLSNGLLETNYSLRYLITILATNYLVVDDVVFYDFNLWLSPMDKYFPKLSTKTARMLEVLKNSPLKVLGTGFILRAHKLDRSQQI